MNIRTTTTTIAAMVGLGLCLSQLVQAETVSPQKPYAGQQDRQIKSLSDQDIEDLLAGRGWGLAKPAEFNGYPGPSHVLANAEELQLSADTKAAMQAIFEEMSSEAKRIGALYVEAERNLDRSFETGEADAQTLEALLRRAEDLRLQLRLVHLKAHLQAAPLLSPHQKMAYAKLRGYGPGHAAGPAPDMGHRHTDKN